MGEIPIGGHAEEVRPNEAAAADAPRWAPAGAVRIIAAGAGAEVAVTVSIDTGNALRAPGQLAVSHAAVEALHA